MRLARIVRPRRSGVIMALRANADLRLVELGECAVRRHKVIVGGCNGIAQLRWIPVRLMRIVTGGTYNSDIRVAGGQWGSVQQAHPHGTGMTAATILDLAGRIIILNDLRIGGISPRGEWGLVSGVCPGDLRVAAGIPLVKRWMARIVMTTPADLGRHFGPWSDRWIIRIGRVARRSAMAALALDVSQLRRFTRADKPCWQIEPHRVAGQTRTVALTSVGLKLRIAERGGMSSMYLRVQDRFVTFHALLNSPIIRRGAGNPEYRIAKTGRNSRASDQIVAPGQRHPNELVSVQAPKQLVITGRPIPCHFHSCDPYAVGDQVRPCDKVGFSRHSARHGATQVLNVLRTGCQASQKTDRQAQKTRNPLNHKEFCPTHILQITE